MTDAESRLPGPGDDFAAWTASRWAELVPEADSTAAAVAIRYIRIAEALAHSHARTIRPWKKHGVNTIDDFRTLGLLRHVGERGVRTQHIADQLDAEPGTVSSRVARLERHGLVERFDDPVDGRARLVRLRSEQHDLVDTMYRALVENHERFFARLSSGEHHELSALLSKIDT